MRSARLKVRYIIIAASCVAFAAVIYFHYGTFTLSQRRSLLNFKLANMVTGWSAPWKWKARYEISFAGIPLGQLIFRQSGPAEIDGHKILRLEAQLVPMWLVHRLFHISADVTGFMANDHPMVESTHIEGSEVLREIWVQYGNQLADSKENRLSYEMGPETFESQYPFPPTAFNAIDAVFHVLTYPKASYRMSVTESGKNIDVDVQTGSFKNLKWHGKTEKVLTANLHIAASKTEITLFYLIREGILLEARPPQTWLPLRIQLLSLQAGPK